MTGYSVAGEGVTKRAASGPFGTFCHHVVTQRAGGTKRAGSASNFTRFVTLVTKRAATWRSIAVDLEGAEVLLALCNEVHGLLT